MEENKIPRGLQDAMNDKDLNQLGAQFIAKYAGHLGSDHKMLDIGAFADMQIMDIDGNSRYWYDMNYKIMNMEGDVHPNIILADITNCPEVPSESFDYIYTQDTFEHISKPWLAGQEMIRLLKPGGIIYCITLFAWRYHKAPEDYFRYTPFGLCSIFDGMNHLEANWDVKNRRGPNGMGLQGDGKANDMVPVDMLGAWRENWRVYYFGQKPYDVEYFKETHRFRNPQ
jgi:SAM-dependent methyltransferase